MNQRIYITYCAIAAFVFYVASTGLAAGVVSVPFVPAGLSLGDTYHIAFVTAGTTDAVSTDIADYNAFVQSQAELAAATTEAWEVDWFAIGSTASVDARDNALVSAPIYLLSGAFVSAGFSDMWDGTILEKLNITQYSLLTAPPNLFVWTGTQVDGTAVVGNSLGGLTGTRQGQTFSTDGFWISGGTSGSNVATLPMYALSEQLTVVPEPATFGTCMLLSGVGAMISFGHRRRDRPSVASRL